MSPIPFQTIDWTSIEKVEYHGTSGLAWWQTILFGDLRIRIVEYSGGYVADHWCQKGHVVYCLEGSFVSELKSGEQHRLERGMMYVVTDEISTHRSVSEEGVKLLIIDGGFLKT